MKHATTGLFKLKISFADKMRIGSSRQLFALVGRPLLSLTFILSLSAFGLSSCKAPKPPAKEGSESTTPAPTPHPKIELSATATVVDMGDSVSLTAFGGTPPIEWSITSGPATINQSGVVTPTASGIVRARAEDSVGEWSEVAINVRGALQVSASSSDIQIGSFITYTLVGGAPPITSSVITGNATIVGSAIYALPPEGSTTIRFTDSKGNNAEISLNVVAPLTVSPATQTMAVGTELQLTTVGGFPPYIYSLVSGGGTLSPSGKYTAPASIGNTKIRVTDSRGTYVESNIVVAEILTIQPLTTTLAVNNGIGFSSLFGLGPYTYSVVSGGGTINPTSGLYIAPSTPGVAEVRVTDSLGATSNATVTINPALQISPITMEKSVSQLDSFTATGGVAPYSYSIVSGGGLIQASTGVFTAPSSPGSVVVRVTDSLGNVSNANVTVYAPVEVSPGSKNITTNGTFTFAGTGGKPPYTFSMVSGQGTINSSSGLYTAPATAGTATVRATDSLGSSGTAVISIYAPPTISPAAPYVAILNTQLFSASGGLSPYTYSVISGQGSVNASSGVFSAPATAGTTVVRVTDSLGGLSDATVTITEALQISPLSSNVPINTNISFSTTGGVPPITYSIVGGPGSIGSTTGSYNSGASAGTATVRATDSVGNTADASVTVRPPVQISPTTLTLAVNNTATFSTATGESPFLFSVISGAGSINPTTGVFTAPTSAGTSVVRVTDAIGNTSDATVTVAGALSITSATNWLMADGILSFSASDGVPPYTFNVQSGSGSVNPSSGVYTAPSTPGSVTVRVTDSLGNTADRSVNVLALMALSPSNSSLLINGNATFSASGGQGPYTFTVLSGGGSINSSTGYYTAPASADAVVLKVEDSLGNSTTTNLTVYTPLTLSPMVTTVGPNYQFNFSSSGGAGSVTYSIVSGGGFIDPNTGAFTAPAGAGSVTVRATDSAANTVDATVTVGAALAINPSTFKMTTLSTRAFAATGGSGGYVFSVFQGGGSINSSTGLFTAANSAETVTVRVTDSYGYTANATVQVVKPERIIAGNYNTCVIYNEGSMKCWGEAGSGQLASASANDIGDVVGELGSAMPFMNLGNNLTFKDVAIGSAHMCAILSNDLVKCWGQGTNGKLGSGGTANIGATVGQTGDGIPYVDLGNNRTAKKIFAGANHNCAILDNDETKCWGLNSSGQLGVGDTTARGSTPGQMGDALPAVNFGTNRYAVSLALSNASTCAILDDNTLKCFGSNGNGLLLIGNTTTKGTAPTHMGDALAVSNLGGSKYAVSITAGATHFCAVLNDGGVKCWGNAASGKLGNASTTAHLGDTALETGDGLPYINLGAGLTVNQASSQPGSAFSCVVLNDQSVKCWGLGTYGVLGQGNAVTLGDGANEMGDLLLPVDLGSGFIPEQVVTGLRHTCAMSTDKRVKCWGAATGGALANGTATGNLGDALNEMGDLLSYVNF